MSTVTSDEITISEVIELLETTKRTFGDMRVRTDTELFGGLSVADDLHGLRYLNLSSVETARDSRFDPDTIIADLRWSIEHALDDAENDIRKAAS